MIYAFSPHALLGRTKLQLLKQLHYQKKLKAECNTLQCSSHSSPPIYNNIEPKEPKSKEPIKAIENSFTVNSPLTNGCRKANITKAIARLINPLPSSKATFLSFIKPIIANKGDYKC